MEKIKTNFESFPIALLEHVNLCIPSHNFAEEYYVNLLGFVLDPKKGRNSPRGTLHFNAGITQIHLTLGDPQIIPGSIVLLHPNLKILKKRLETSPTLELLKESKFSWKEREEDGTFEIIGPYGNCFKVREAERSFGRKNIPGAHLHGNLSEMIGIVSIEFKCKMNQASKITEYYQKFF
mmetsp:Transcript_5979/g.9000  ORF Transcript_5979/g.9000 Transcript_5979/m.9000 type:complete len:179 (+) Transcript_5979:37-573(+)